MAEDKIFILNSGSHSPDLVVDSSEVFWLNRQDSAGFTRTGDTTFTVTNNADNQAIFQERKPLRYRTTLGSGTYSYGIIKSYSSGTVTIAGAALPATVGQLQVGPNHKVTYTHINIPGDMEVTTDALNNSNLVQSRFIWQAPTAYCVYLKGQVLTAAAGANLQIAPAKNSGANDIFSAVVDFGTATTLVDTTTVNTSNYQIDPDDRILMEITQIGSTTAGSDMTVYLVFVTE